MPPSSALRLLMLLLLSVTGCSSNGWLPLAGITYKWQKPRTIQRTQADRIRSDRIWFIQTNLESLRHDARRGAGAQLFSYANLRGCPDYTHYHFASLVRSAADEIFRYDDANRIHRSLEERLEADPLLRRACATDGTLPANGPVPRLLELAHQRRAVVLPLKTLGEFPKDTAEILTGLLVTELSRVHNLEALGPQDVEALLRAEAMKDLIDCDDTICLAEIGGALDTDLVLHGNIAHLGGQYIIILNIVDSSETRVRGRVRRVLPAEVDVLTGALGDMTAEVVMRLDGSG